MTMQVFTLALVLCIAAKVNTAIAEKSINAHPSRRFMSKWKVKGNVFAAMVIGLAIDIAFAAFLAWVWGHFWG